MNAHTTISALASVAAPYAPKVDSRPFQLLDTTDDGSHRGIEEPGQVYADEMAHQYGRTVTISTCEGSVDVEGSDFDDLVIAYLRRHPELRKGVA